MTKTAASPIGVWCAGTVQDLEPTVARLLIAAGAAVPLEPVTPLTPVTEIADAPVVVQREVRKRRK